MFCNKCGRELPDGSKFCSGCGISLEQKEEVNVTTEDVQEENVQQESVQQENVQQAYSQQTYNQQAYNQQAYYQQPYNQTTYYQQPYNQQQSEYMRYKKKVAPFKVIAAVINLLTSFTVTILGLAFFGIGLGVDEYEVVLKVDESIGPLFTVCAGTLLLFAFVMFIGSIVAIIVPAKAGVTTNLVFTIICSLLMIWAIVLNVDLSGVVRELELFGYGSANVDMISDIVVGFYVFIFAVILPQLISLVLSIIGMAFKKNK